MTRTSIEPNPARGPHRNAEADRPPRGAASIAVPWGPDGSLELRWPADGPLAGAAVEVVEPDLTGPVADYPAALRGGAGSPVDAPRLEDQVGPGRSVAIVVDDPSRWTPVREALPIVLARLHAAGVRAEDVTISVGVGRHHAVDAEAMRRRVGDDVAAGYRCFSPPVDDLSAYVELGTVEPGIPVRVFRPVAEADLRILIGSVLPHLQAGFGGGYKLIFPGTSHRSTLGALHRQGLVGRSDATGLLGGDAAENPMRRAIHAAAGAAGPLLVDQPPDRRARAGLPRDRRPARDASRTCWRPRRGGGSRRRRPRRPTSSSPGNHPWPGDPMQSFKVLLHHRAACRPGGVLVGLFWTDPDEIGRSFPIAALRRIAATGASAPGRSAGWSWPPSTPPRWPARRPPFMIRWARELVVDRTVLVYAPPLRERVGPRLGPVRLFADLDALVARCSSGQWADRLRVRRVFPQGGLTYVPGVGRRSNRSRQEIRHRDPPDLDAADHHRHVLSGPINGSATGSRRDRGRCRPRPGGRPG